MSGTISLRPRMPRCAACGVTEQGDGDFDDVVALCSDHNEGPFCGPCLNAHSEETGCGTDGEIEGKEGQA